MFVPIMSCDSPLRVDRVNGKYMHGNWKTYMKIDITMVATQEEMSWSPDASNISCNKMLQKTSKHGGKMVCDKLKERRTNE